ncbi:hypothetical protein EVAR_49961_1 [Eumeta japonica]|uniref:Uncharacterized protein n=1 Tax=Eumeta variegata TaxID=151549 RepID=A0A4C1XSQ0_EUMVA|nr:hypothetical protein EVAR_49961_1 [Eumeta japonica]
MARPRRPRACVSLPASILDLSRLNPYPTIEHRLTGYRFERRDRQREEGKRQYWILARKPAIQIFFTVTSEYGLLRYVGKMMDSVSFESAFLVGELEYNCDEYTNSAAICR